MSDIAAVRSGLYFVLTNYITNLTAASHVFKYAPSSPPDTYPFAYISMREGEVSGTDGQVWRYSGHRETQHQVYVTLCFSLQSDLADAEKNAEGYIKKVVDAIDLHQTLNGTVVSASVSNYEVVEVKLRPSDPQSYYGLRFKVWVLEIEEGTLVGP